jgi:ParB family chromosome partitioning protein
MGERRFRAAKEAGLTAIPAVIRDTTDENMLRDALLENLHRADLNPLEEASAYKQLLEDFGITQEQLADRLGRSRPQITNTLRLLRLPMDVQQKLVAGVLTAGHARALLGADSEELMSELAGRVIREGLSVRGLEELIASGVGKKKKPTIKPGGACTRTW